MENTEFIRIVMSLVEGFTRQGQDVKITILQDKTFVVELL